MHILSKQAIIQHKGTPAVKRLIPELRHPESNEICSTPPQLHDAVCSFYQPLYTPEDIDHANVELLTNSIPTTDRLSDTCHSLITRPFHISEIRQGASRSPRRSSPGPDGLPYEILCVALENERSAALATKVYSDALQNALYPSSWQETCMSLLPKKGDLTSLKNWRPISLINTDAKAFTRLLNARLMPYLSKIITTNQLGFMPGRFIADHGQLLQLIQMSAEKTDSTTIGLLLDQEKAYDRIHPSYLSRIMLAFNIPQLIVDTVISLFFYTRIQVNINGHLTDTRITQSRGLRQGDPLSPLLFNIAFDPFLRMVSQDRHLKGFNFPTELPSSHLPASFEYTLQRFDQLHLSEDAPNIDPSVEPSHGPPSVSPPSVKILAYADDALVFLKDTSDFLRLQQAVNIYSTASNALLNYNKTQAFSLSGDPHPQWQAFLAEHNITLRHDRNSPSHLTYLGFAICSSTSQRSHFANLPTQKIQHACFCLIH
ncbi:hypothetical protein G6F30_012350 [Rhizopus arrhizus]|nr:hypothetical protein G6F30_012350 [Rhizopus arrhizus]